MQFIVIILFLVSYLNSYSQCDGNTLSKRPKEIYKDSVDKKIKIRLWIQNDRQIVQMINANLGRLQKYITSQFEIPEKPIIDSYISDLIFTETLFSKIRITETEKLDGIVFCYLMFMEQEYVKIKRAIAATKNIKDVYNAILVIYDRIEKQGSIKINAINQEVHTLDLKFVYR